MVIELFVIMKNKKMIIKIKTYKRPRYGKLLKYMLYDEDRLFNKEKRSFVITHNLKGNTISQWEKQFKENEIYRKRKRTDSVYLTHEIISFHKDDAENITLGKLENMARTYIQKRNINGMFVAVPHFDKEHYHIHICASGLEYHTGKSLRMTKAEFQKLKKDIQEYQKERFPELSKSIVKHDKKGRGQDQDKKQNKENNKATQTEKEYQYKLRTGRATEKEQAIGMLKTCYKASISKDDFYQKLKDCGLKTYIRGGKTTGVIFGNHKFRLNRIGFTEERLEELNKTFKRGSELNKTRETKENKEKDKNLDHNI